MARESRCSEGGVTMETLNMAPANKNPGAAATANPDRNNKLKFNNSSIPKKWERVLAAFYRGQSFNRFEAERQLNDHCLHSTVSTLQDMGLVIERQFETVPGYRNIPTRVCRYWLHPESKERARKLLPRSLAPEDEALGGSRFLWEGVANGSKEQIQEPPR